jgi:hypothetical protein
MSQLVHYEFKKLPIKINNYFMLKKLKFFLILILVLFFSYSFTAMYSFHQLHKGIYFNDKQLIENYVDWQSVRGNVKNYINVEILKKSQSEEIFKQLR